MPILLLAKLYHKNWSRSFEGENGKCMFILSKGDLLAGLSPFAANKSLGCFIYIVMFKYLIFTEIRW